MMQSQSLEKRHIAEKEDKMTVVSIIVPVYNAEKYLREAIESVLKQTYPAFELLLINDASTDGSKEICMEYRKKDSRIIFLDNDSDIHGPGPTRNIGLDHATGEYIYFMDADDWIDERLLECTVGRMRETGADIVLVGLKDEQPDRTIALYCSWKGKPILNKEDIGKDFAGCWSRINYFWLHLYRHETIKTIRFGSLINGEDLCYWMDALYKADMIAFADEVYYHYRYVPGSTFHRWNRDMIACRGDIWAHQRRFLDSLPGNVDQSIYAGVAYENYTWALRLLSMDLCPLSYQEKKRELSELRDRMDFDALRGSYPLKLQNGLLRVKFMLVKYHLEGLILLLGPMWCRMERVAQLAAQKHKKR